MKIKKPAFYIITLQEGTWSYKDLSESLKELLIQKVKRRYARLSALVHFMKVQRGITEKNLQEQFRNKLEEIHL